MSKLHCITGLPRSGSTMLSAILLQNPRFHAGMSSGALGTANTIVDMCSSGELAEMVPEELSKKLTINVLDTYFAHWGKEVIFDTNRRWTSFMDLALSYDADCKFIAMVRNPAWVLDSVERFINAEPFKRSKLANRHLTMKQRAEQHFSSGGFIGHPMECLTAAMYGPQADKLLIVDYDVLCENPAETLDAIYDFTGEEKFEHDFSNLSYSAESFDEMLQAPGLHTVKGPVEVKERVSVLPPAMFGSLQKYRCWGKNVQTRATQIVGDL